MMPEFSVTTQVTPKDYMKALFRSFYTNPLYIVAMLFAFVYFIVIPMLDLFKITHYYKRFPFGEVLFFWVILLVPIIKIFTALKKWKKSPDFTFETKYIFNNDKVIAEGKNFRSEFIWTHFTKYSEIDNYLILSNDRKGGYYIDKRKLTADQIHFIKLKIRKKI